MISRRRAALLFSLVLSAAAAAQVESLQRGVELFRQKKYEAALAQFEQARAEHPMDASIPNFIGVIETQLGKITEANADYEKAIKLDPLAPAPHKNLGFNYLGARQYQTAEEQLKLALDLDRNDPFPHYYLAILYLATLRDQEAVLQVEPAESLLEDDPANGFLMAKACLRASANVQAVKIIGALEQRSSLSVPQEYELAALLDQKAMYLESAQRYRRVVQMQPAVWENKYNLALALVKAGQAPQALPVLEPLAGERPNDARVLSLLGSAYNSAGKVSPALEAYRKAVAADAQNPDRYLDYTQLLMDINRYDDALRFVQQGLQVIPDPYPLNVRLGVIEMVKGEYDKARGYFLTAIQEHPEVPMAHVIYAQTYMKQGNDEEALKILTDARQKVSRDFALEYALGLVSVRQGKREQAIEALTNAEQMQPGVVEPHYQLGMLYMQAEQWSKAKEEFERVLQFDPQRAAAYFQLSRAYARMGDEKKSREMGLEAGRLTQSQREDAIKTQKDRLASAPTQ